MKTYLLSFFSVLLFWACTSNAQIPKSIYDFKVASLDGKTIDFSKFKGKKILIVNTASKCGFTKQYAELEELSQKYKDKLVIVGFPANDFMKQEPGSNQEIGEFCKRNYGVTFFMAEKISVKGQGMAPIYHWLTDKAYNKVESSSIKWNFQKYLIDEKGNLVRHFNSAITPLSDDIIGSIEK